MKAFILAGGQSLRLRPITRNMPKPLIKLDFEGNRIIDAQILALKKHGITDINIITGFEAEKVKKHLSNRFPDTKITYIHNKEYETTYPSYAFWLAKEYLQGPLLYINGDVVFSENILTKIITSKHESVTAIRLGDWDEEEVNVVTDKENKILEIGKFVSAELSTGEFVGITKMNTSFTECFIQALNYFESIEERKRFAADSINFAIQKYKGTMHIELIKNEPVIEVDTIEDYTEAKKMWKRIKKTYDIS